MLLLALDYFPLNQGLIQGWGFGDLVLCVCVFVCFYDFKMNVNSILFKCTDVMTCCSR